MNFELVRNNLTQFKFLKPRASQDELWTFKLSNLNRRQCKWNKKYRKYIQREKKKLKPPPLEFFHGKFKTYACVLYSASKNYIQDQITKIVPLHFCQR
jgi:hypothetical protein